MLIKIMASKLYYINISNLKCMCISNQVQNFLDCKSPPN